MLEKPRGRLVSSPTPSSAAWCVPSVFNETQWLTDGEYYRTPPPMLSAVSAPATKPPLPIVPTINTHPAKPGTFNAIDWKPCLWRRTLVDDRVHSCSSMVPRTPCVKADTAFFSNSSPLHKVAPPRAWLESAPQSKVSLLLAGNQGLNLSPESVLPWKVIGILILNNWLKRWT